MFTDTFIVFHFSLFFTRESHPSVLPPEQHPRNYIPLWALYCFQSLGGRRSSVQKSLAETFTGIICDNVNILVMVKIHLVLLPLPDGLLSCCKKKLC